MRNLPYWSHIRRLNNRKMSKDGEHWRALYANGDTATYFDILGVKHIHDKIKRYIGNKFIIKYIFRIQAYVLTLDLLILCLNAKAFQILRIWKSITEKIWPGHLIIISQHLTMQTGFCLFSQIRPVVFLFAYLLLSFVHLL